MTSQSRNPRRSGNPAVRAGSASGSPARAELEKRSRPILVRLAAVPRLAVLLTFLVWLLAGLLLPHIVGGVLLIALAAALTWLVAVSWPILAAGPRVLRVVTLALVLGGGVRRLIAG